MQLQSATTQAQQCFIPPLPQGSRQVITIPTAPQEQSRAVTRQLRVAAYCRVSTDQDEQLTSYEAQKQYYTDLIIQKKEWAMAGILADEGITETSAKKRPQFLKLMRMCERSKVDVVLTKSISRFARNTVDCLKYVRKLQDLGIAVIFEKENINTLHMEGELLITVLVMNNHAPIVSREMFEAVQAERTRRSGKRKMSDKTSMTGQSKYCGKYALSEILICGDCGTPYKRVTWARNGVKRIVWRCINRIDYGTKYCRTSPTIEESKLHTTIAFTEAAKPLVNHQLDMMLEVLEAAPLTVTAYDDNLTRQLIDTIKVMGDRRLLIVFKDGRTMEQGM